MTSKQDLEEHLRSLIATAAERAEQHAPAEVVALADSDDPVEQMYGVVMLRLYAGAVAFELQASLIKSLIEEGDVMAAINCCDFTAAMGDGFSVAANYILSQSLPETFSC